ncbi:hypothetical protein [Mediterraneibacter gnavus]|uniref:Uncharacterized protein n=1 Tax=Mediterraneibacter gnavus TaxID=33038 RepID=A0A2N5PY01_MEDGN|nr:hypothetical protein [Mediterraneibacter gnavus]PLT84527.1 hypothetical protein CDL20_11550 [Mediterraneibacter gnavus]
MIIKYEIACREAGLSEENTAEIRKFLDAEQKKLKRRKEAKKKTQLCFLSVEEMAAKIGEDDIESCDIPDPTMNTEEMAIKRFELSVLRSCMDELSQEDKEFLLACFACERGAVAELTRKLEIPQTTVSSRKKALFEKVQKRFFEKYEKSQKSVVEN